MNISNMRFGRKIYDFLENSRNNIFPKIASFKLKPYKYKAND